MKLVKRDVAATWFPKVSQDEALEAIAAADAWVDARTRWPETQSDGVPLEPPSDLVQACRLLASRYLARRNSPDGFVGMGEMGPARITTVDRDVESLIAPWRPVVFG